MLLSHSPWDASSLLFKASHLLLWAIWMSLLSLFMFTNTAVWKHAWHDCLQGWGLHNSCWQDSAVGGYFKPDDTWAQGSASKRAMSWPRTGILFQKRSHGTSTVLREAEIFFSWGLAGNNHWGNQWRHTYSSSETYLYFAPKNSSFITNKVTSC